MYLVERTFVSSNPNIDDKGIIDEIEKTRMTALGSIGIEVPSEVNSQTRKDITKQMTEDNRIIYRSHYGYKDKEDDTYVLKTVTLFVNEDAYKYHAETTLGVPPTIDESNLDMNTDSLNTVVAKAEIKRK